MWNGNRSEGVVLPSTLPLTKMQRKSQADQSPNVWAIAQVQRRASVDTTNAACTSRFAGVRSFCSRMADADGNGADVFRQAAREVFGQRGCFRRLIRKDEKCRSTAAEVYRTIGNAAYFIA